MLEKVTQTVPVNVRKFFRKTMILASYDDFFAGGVVIVMILAITVIALMPLFQRDKPVAMEPWNPEAMYRGGWRSGMLPVGVPVIGAWRVGDVIICKEVVYTGMETWEYWGDGKQTWPVERAPDWWVELPEGGKQ